jgi:hypothetical protein
LDEGERIAGLRLYIDADHVEARTVVAHGRTASAAEQIKQLGPHMALHDWRSIQARTSASGQSRRLPRPLIFRPGGKPSVSIKA